MIRAKMAELRYIVVSGVRFAAFQISNFFLRSSAYEYLNGNFRECSSVISQFYDFYQDLIGRAF